MQISEEEKKAKSNLKDYIEDDSYYNKTIKIESDFDRFCYEHCKDIDIILNLTEKQNKESEIKDKMIEELIDTLNKILTDRPASIFPYIFKDNRIDNKCIKCGLIENNTKTCKDCIKEYFRKKVME